jgi:ATP-dependent DNA helicase RecG
VICPLIEIAEESSTTNLLEDERKSVKAEYEKLQLIFPQFEIGMLHGRMKSKEKDEVMKEFSANRTQLLVSTSVVEVGVDVPNASVMMIEDAERFGLAQLHQFRGRVGRSEHQSFCFLFSSTMSEKAIKRLKALESTNDGFKLAEIDLETRGPGAVFGTEQSGLLDLKMADFSDRVLVEHASSAAKSIISIDPELKNHPLLKQKIADYLENKHLE